MDSTNQVSLSEKVVKNQDLDNVIGTNNKIPRLHLGDSFSEWKFRFSQYMKMKDPKTWRSICRGPSIITYVLDEEKGTTGVKPVSAYSDEDYEKVEIDDKALAMLHTALVPEIDIGVREVKSSKELWESLLAMYEGNLRDERE